MSKLFRLLGDILGLMKLCSINPTEMHRTVVYELARQLAMRKNYEITILQPIGRRREEKEWGSASIHENIKGVHFPSFFFPSISYGVPFFHKEAKVLLKLLSDARYNVIQARNYEYLTSIPPIFMRKKYNVPIILTCDALPRYSWFYGDVFVDIVAEIYTYSIGKWILNSYDKVILLCKKASEEVEKFGVSKERISIIPNRVDPKDFKSGSGVEELQNELSIEEDEKILLFVGRLAKVKRLEILIALTESLLGEGFRLKTVVVGDGPSRFMRDCQNRSETMFCSLAIPHNEVYNYYMMSDVFVLPSLSEGLPTVLFEASAAGKPSVASNVYGVRDIVKHEKTGYLVRRSDTDSYTQHVKILLTNEDSARQMGAKAAEFVGESFNWDVIVDELEKLYREILD